MIIQPIEEFPVSNQICITENPSIPRNVSEHFMNIDVAQSKNVDLLQSFEQPRHSLNVLDKPIQADQLTIQPKKILRVQETFNKVILLFIIINKFFL